MNAVTSDYSVDELVQRLNEAGVPCGPINTIKEAFDNAQVKHLGMAVPAPHPDMGDLNLVRSPINLSFPPRAIAAASGPGSGSERCCNPDEYGV